jgi:predicted ATPase
MCNSALQFAEEISHPYSQSFAYSMASVLYAEMREVKTSLKYAQQAVSHSKKEGFPFLMALGMTMRGWARSELEKTSVTIGQMRRGIDGMKLIGAELGRPIFLSLLAETYGKNGQVKEGLAVIDEAILIASKNRERLNESELYRLKGELLELQGEKETKILECLHKGIEIAQHQKAKSMELRGIMKLYSYQQKHGLSITAQKDLANIYGWFTEGFDSEDLVEARNLLEQDN